MTCPEKRFVVRIEEKSGDSTIVAWELGPFNVLPNRYRHQLTDRMVIVVEEVSGPALDRGVLSESPVPDAVEGEE